MSFINHDITHCESRYCLLSSFFLFLILLFILFLFFFFVDIWNITYVGPAFTQAKVVGGNQATNGLAWNYPQKYDIFYFFMSLFLSLSLSLFVKLFNIYLLIFITIFFSLIFIYISIIGGFQGSAGWQCGNTWRELRTQRKLGITKQKKRDNKKNKKKEEKKKVNLIWFLLYMREQIEVHQVLLISDFLLLYL